MVGVPAVFGTVIALGLSLWIWILVRVPRARWRSPEHWVKTVILTVVIVLGLVALSFVISVVVGPLLGRYAAAGP